MPPYTATMCRQDLHQNFFPHQSVSFSRLILFVISLKLFSHLKWGNIESKVSLNVEQQVDTDSVSVQPAGAAHYSRVSHCNLLE